MLDWIESMELAAEKTLDDMTEGLAHGKFRCGCGNITDLDDAHFLGHGPYSDPSCGKCLDVFLAELAGKKGMG